MTDSGEGPAAISLSVIWFCFATYDFEYFAQPGAQNCPYRLVGEGLLVGLQVFFYLQVMVPYRLVPRKILVPQNQRGGTQIHDQSMGKSKDQTFTVEK